MSKGHDGQEDKQWTEHKRDEKKNGYSFDKMAICMREAAKEALCSESSRISNPETLEPRGQIERYQRVLIILLMSWFDLMSLSLHPRSLNITAEEHK